MEGSIPSRPTKVYGAVLYVYIPKIEVTKRKIRSRQLNDVKNNSQAGNFLVDIIPVMSYIENIESDKRSSLVL